MSQPGIDVDIIIDDVGYLVTQWQQKDVTPFANKIASGDPAYADGSFDSVWSQTNWAGGRGQDYFDDPERFRDSYNLDTRIKGQVMLGPNKIKALKVGDPAPNPEFVPGQGAQPITLAQSRIEYNPTVNTYVSVSANVVYAETFVVPAGGMTISAIWLKLSKVNTFFGRISVGINNTSGGLPGSTNYIYEDISATSIPPSANWVRVTFDSSTALAAGTYCVYLQHYDPSGGRGIVPTNGIVRWHGTTGTSGYSGTCSKSSYDGTTWATYVAQSFDLAFRAGSNHAHFAQSFTVGAAEVACTHVYLKLQRMGTISGDVTVNLLSSAGGLPNASLKNVTLAASSIPLVPTWTKFTWSSAQVLSASTQYWVAISPPADNNDLNKRISWIATSGNKYAAGSAAINPGQSGSWGAYTSGYDFAFKVNNGLENLEGPARDFVQYQNRIYACGGNKILEWQPKANVFSCVFTTGGAAEIRQLITWSPAAGSNLLVATVVSNNEVPGPWHFWDGTTKATAQANWRSCNNYGPHYVEIHEDRLYLGTWNELYWTTNFGLDGLRTAKSGIDDQIGDGWTKQCNVGDGWANITGMASLDGNLYAGKYDGVYLVQDDRAINLLNFRSVWSWNNCVNMTEWQGSIYIPTNSGGLWRFNGSTMVAVGPDLDRGMPGWTNPSRAGNIKQLLGTMNTLYTAYNAGRGQSSILAYNNAGWHEVIRAATASEHISAVRFAPTVSSNWQMWWGQGNDIYYAFYDNATDNPWGYVDRDFISQGYLDMSWFNGGLQEIDKTFTNITVEAGGVSRNSTPGIIPEGPQIEVYYDLDIDPYKDPVFQHLGTIDTPPRQTLAFPVADSPVVGKSMALRFWFQHNGNAANTPILRSFALRYLPKPKPRYGWSVTIPIQDDLILLNRAKCTTTAAQLKAALHSARASTAPIYFCDRDGTAYYAHCTSLTFQMNKKGTNNIQYVAKVSLVEADPTLRN